MENECENMWQSPEQQVGWSPMAEQMLCQRRLEQGNSSPIKRQAAGPGIPEKSLPD